MDAILKTELLTKSYKGTCVVKGVNMNVPRHCVYGLVGPNGAGKSTILKMIAGIIRQSSGALFFNGHHWNRSDLKDIGALIENPPVYGNLTAYENMELRSMMLNIGKGRIKEVLSIVGLQDTGRKRAGEFSLGMKQRLGIALAIINEPKFLILDEPTNGLDPFGIEELRSLIKSFSQSGMTVLLSSHILSEVEHVADYVGILSDGELLYEGQYTHGINLEEVFMKVARNRRD